MGIESGGVVAGGGIEGMNTHVFSLSRNHPQIPQPEGEEFSLWDINPISSCLLLRTGQLYLYYSKMWIIFLQNVGTGRLMIREGCRISHFQGMCCLYSRHVANWEFTVINKGRISLI